jgi:receptor expression-enhancing protein 1/2/3/4
MRFEEIEVPSDVEGYDVGAAGGSGKAADSSGAADAVKRSSGWFAGWGSPGKEGEKTKSD